MVTQFWESWQAEKTSFFALSAWWNAGKARLWRKVCAFSRKQASSFRQRVSSLEHTLFFLSHRADNGEYVDGLIADAKAELESLHRDRSRRARICSNVQWAEEGEASTAYFFRLERSIGACRLFTSICNLSAVVVSTLVGISYAWVSFYGQLFRAQPLNVSEQDSFLDQLNLSLTDLQNHLCEGELTLGECTAGVGSFRWYRYWQITRVGWFPSRILSTLLAPSWSGLR